MKNRLTKLSLIVLTALFSVSASAQLKDGDYNAESKGVNFQRFPTLDAKKLVNAPKMSAHHRGICHF